MKQTGLKFLMALCAGLVFTAFVTTAPAAQGHMSGTHMFDKGMQPILASYLKIQETLAADSFEGVRAAAQAIVKHAAKLDAKSVKGEHAKHYESIPAKLKEAATILSKAGDIAAAREALKAVSKPMAMWGTMSTPSGIDVVFCSMAKASWLQQQGAVRNPYYGKSMLACGEVVGGAGHKGSAMKH